MTNATATDPAGAVEAFEALPLGEPWAAAHATAVKAIDELIARSHARLFPPDVPDVPPEAFAHFSFMTGHFGVGRARIDQQIAFHAQMVRAGRYDLAALARSRPQLDIVSRAATLNMDPASKAVALDAAASKFHRACAGHLAATDHDPADAARALLHGFDLAARAIAEETRREAHAADVLARAEADRREAERVRVQELDAVYLAAQADTERLKSETVQAARKERALHGSRLADRLEASKLEAIGEGSHLGAVSYSAREVANLARADQFSAEQLASMEHLLDATLARKAQQPRRRRA
jgi:hypothetical protein